jgi:hypothetical protein
MHQFNPESYTSNFLENSDETVSLPQDTVAPDELLHWLEECEISEDEPSQVKGIALSRHEWETIAEAWDAAQISPKKLITDHSPLDDDLADEVDRVKG